MKDFPALEDTVAIVPDGLEGLYDGWHFAPAVRSGDMLYLSGIIGADAELKVSEDPETQFVQVFETMGHTLRAAGADFSHVIELTSYHLRLEDTFKTFSTIKDQYFSLPHCAWTAVGVSALLLPAALVEVKAIARLASGSSSPG
jgi:enamine deaminase RidA (YjgF/YER057c/UK114 family)